MIPLDEIREVAVGVGATAVRHAPQTLDVFTTHFPRFPVLPGVLILEDLVAVARLALDGGDSACADDRWEVAAARRVRYRHFVQPGDSMEIKVVVSGVDAGTAKCNGVVRVDGKPVTIVNELVLRLVQKGLAT